MRREKTATERKIEQSPIAPLRIGILVDALNSGGAQRQAVMLAKALKSRGHDVAVCVYTPGRFYAADLHRDQIELVELYPRYRWQKVAMVYQWLWSWRPQILQTYIDGSNTIAELTSLLPHGWKIVVSERKTGPAPTWTTRLRWQLHRRADWVTANSHANMAQLLQVAPSLRAKSSVIWNMVDLDHFRPPATAPVWRQGETVRFLCVASMEPRKNALRLVEALHVLRQRGIDNFHVRWVGNVQQNAAHAKAYADMMRMVRWHGLAAYFTFVGEKANVVAEYHAADALVLVSLSEGLPNVVCEAMACGLPVVLSDVSDNAKLVEDGRAGVLCSPYDVSCIAGALQTIIERPESQRRLMREAARKTAEECFQQARFASAYERVYHTLLQDDDRIATVGS